MQLVRRVLALGVGFLALVATSASFSNVAPQKGVKLRSLFYDFTLMAETGPTFTALGDAPSVNRSGTVAFQGQNASGQGVWSSDGLAITDLTPGFDGSTRAFGRAVMLSDAGNAIESDRVNGAPPLTFIRLWPGSGSGAFTTLGRGGTGQPHDSVLSHPALSANGAAWAFTTLATGSVVRQLVTPLGATDLLGNQGTGYRPLVADDGTVVLRDSNAALLQIQVFRGGNPNNLDVAAGGSAGFTQLGNQPGISDSGKIVAFSGDRGNGPGVFVAYEQTPGVWTITRVAGEGAAAQGNRPDLGFDVTLPVNNPIFFSGVDFNSRVAVMHQERGPAGLAGDTIVVTFIGTPNGLSDYPRFGNYPGLFFRQATGIWTVRLDLHLDSASVLQPRKRHAVPVAQVGDNIDGASISGFVVASLAIHDPLAEATNDDQDRPLTQPAGSHRIAFWASNAAGKQVILRGTHVNSCLLAVRQFSQCDSRWSNTPYVASGLTFCDLACALTTQTMAANYGADFYDINQTWTPLEVHNFIRSRNGFKANNIEMPRSIQALRQPTGLLSLQANTLRFVPKYLSVKPTSSAATVNAALAYIDGNLCDDDNPAPVVLGVDREIDVKTGVLTPGHYILQSGRVNDRRFISDAGYQNAILFSQGTTTKNPISTRYQNNFLAWGIVVDPPDLGGMTIAVGGSATLLVTNALGQSSGFVAGNDEPVQGIPGATFFFLGLRNLQTQGPVGDIEASFHVPSAGVAPYTVQVIGSSAGSFTLTVDVIGADGSLKPPVDRTDTISAGQIKTYLVTPGSGGVTIVPGGGTPVVGDIDGDGDVDSNDLNLLLADRNLSVASGKCGAKCDLNNDGRIDALDSRKLVLLCTRARCAKN